MFDPHTFLYCEEPILAFRMKRIGFYEYFYNRVAVIHEHSYTIKKLGQTFLAEKMAFQSIRYVWEQYCVQNFMTLLIFDFAYFIYFKLWHPLIYIRQTILKRMIK